MSLHGLDCTCSMSELGLSSGCNYTIEHIRKMLETDNVYGPPHRQRKAIICNTCDYEDILERAGFKEIAQYNGNDGPIVHVMLYIQPKSRIKPPKPPRKAKATV